MKKRNFLLSVVSLSIIAILIILLLLSCALLWGRVVAPILPNFIITNIWEWIHNTKFATDCMNWIYQQPLYQLMSVLSRDAEGNLEPLKYILGLMGFVSFAFGAINEVRSTRSMGMLMSDVIHYVFPYHLIIHAPLYVAFAVVGYYACLRNVGIAAFTCLTGIIICFTYSLIMAWCLIFSTKAKERLVLFYINGIVISYHRHYKKRCKSRKSGNVKKDTTGKQDTASEIETNLDDGIAWKKVVGVCTLDYAKHIGQQWITGNILQIQRDNEWTQERKLINLVAFGLTGKRESLKEKLKYPSAENELRIAGDFKKIFADKTNFKKYGPQYVLFANAISASSKEENSHLELDIIRCSQIWEQLFSQNKNKYKRAQLSYAVLWTAKSSQWQSFTIMAIGLLKFLGVARCDYEASDAKKVLEKRIAFLHDIRLSASEIIPEENISSFSSFNDNWAEILYLVAGLVQWMISTDCLDGNIGEAVLNNLLGTVQHNMSKKCFTQLRKDMEIYVVLSYLLFILENMDIRRDMSAYIIQYLFPDVNDKLDIFKNK